jgi:hypothetical protein
MRPPLRSMSSDAPSGVLKPDKLDRSITLPAPSEITCVPLPEMLAIWGALIVQHS